MYMKESDSMCVCVCGHDSPFWSGSVLEECVCSYERSYM